MRKDAAYIEKNVTTGSIVTSIQISLRSAFDAKPNKKQLSPTRIYTTRRAARQCRTVRLVLYQSCDSPQAETCFTALLAGTSRNRQLTLQTH